MRNTARQESFHIFFYERYLRGIDVVYAIKMIPSIVCPNSPIFLKHNIITSLKASFFRREAETVKYSNLYPSNPFNPKILIP